MREIARLLVPSIRWDAAAGFTPARPAVMRALAAGVGGFVVEGGRCDAVAALAADIRSNADEAPILVLAPSTLTAAEWTVDPLALSPIGAVASLRDPLVLRRTARAVAREVRRAGCNAMLAPSCDVSIVANADSFGSDATTVAAAVSEWIDATQAEGVLCFAGHFPGAGRIQSTRAMPVVLDGDDLLYATDLVPFRAAIDGGVAGLLIADAVYPALDASRTPAPISPSILRKLLRDQLGFDGLVLADARALALRSPTPIPASALVAAGVDLILRPANVDVELRVLMDAVQSGQLDRERVHDAASRSRARAEMASLPTASADGFSHDQAWLGDVAERAISVVRGRSVHVAPPIEVAVVGLSTERASAMAIAFAAGISDAGGDGSSVRHVPAPSAVVRSTFVLVIAPHDNAMIAADSERATSLGAQARRLGRDVAVVWCGHPADDRAFADDALVVACWSSSETMVRAAGRWLVRRV
jgi:beta-glucosidase-like glycosyl hydrolase